MTDRIVRGDWFDLAARADLALFTANAVVTGDGRLVMGAGLARAVRDRFPGIDRQLGGCIRQAERPDDYHMAVVFRYERPLCNEHGRVVGIGAFQVKGDWRAPAGVDLIARSIQILNRYLIERPDDWRVVLNYPGIGLGGLPRATVAPLLEALDDRMIICTT
jgi:hypothetical protein